MTTNGHWHSRIIGAGEEAPDQLLANPANWRVHPKHQQEALAGVLNEVGWVQNIIVNQRTGHVVDGHLRVSLALQRNEPSVPVLYVDLSEDEERLILAALDPIAALAVADKSKLDGLLQSVQSGEAAVQQLLADVAQGAGLYLDGNGKDDPGADTTRAAEWQAKWGAADGQLWAIGQHRLLVGDSTDPTSVQRLMGNERAGLIVTDPPYAVGYIEKARDMNRRGYGHSRATLGAAIEGDELSETDCAEIWRGAFTVAISQALNKAAWYVWHASSRARRTMLNLLHELGLLHHETIIWVKNNFVIGRSDYQPKHEECWYGWVKGDRPPFYGPKNQTTVWQIARDTNKALHPTQKPVECFRIPIENHLRPTEIVYDPFVGSGTAIVAAEQTKRRCYAMDKSPLHAAVALERMAGMGLEPQLVKVSRA